MTSLRLLAVLATVLVLGTPGFSSAAFTSRSTSTTGVEAGDWTGPVVSVDAPGSPVSGTATLSATATDTSAVASVTIQRSSDGTTWTVVCTDTAAPYECGWDTTGVADGDQLVRAEATDTAGNSTTSTPVAVTVSNTLRAYDVRAVDAATPRRLAAGDQVVLTYSAVVDPGSVVTGWDGSGGRAVTVTVANNGTNDTMTFGVATLGSVALRKDFASGAVSFPSTVSISTATIAGTPRSVVVVVLGTPSGTASLNTVNNSPADLVWTPSGSVRTPGGAACTTAPLTEPDDDRDF